MTETITVDIWSDIACPWCFIGKRRFERAVAVFAESRPGVEIKIESHSYELAPDTPETFSGSEIDFLVKHKGMPRMQVEQMLGQMTDLAATEGIAFDFERIHHINTRRAHRLLHLAKRRGLQAEVQEALFSAYFSEGQDLSDADRLVAVVVSAGLDADEARAALDDEELGEAVDFDIRRAKMLGVSGVPFFLFDHKYSMPGAQSTEVFADALGRVLELGRADDAESGADGRGSDTDSAGGAGGGASKADGTPA